MLDALNLVEVREGDVLFVPAGIPHAIGEGVLIVELRSRATSPSCSSGEGFVSGEDEASLGLGWDVALRCVDRSGARPRAGCTADASPPRPSPSSAPSGSKGRRPPRWSAASRSSSSREARPSCTPAPASRCGSSRGDTVLVPWDAGACRLEGELVGVACWPPAADAGARRELTSCSGIDLGTSACKAALIDRDGVERAHGQSTTPWRRTATGAEIECEALFEAAVAAVRAR